MFRLGIPLVSLGLAVSPALADSAIVIPFVAEIGGVPFSCDKSYSLGIGGTLSGVLDFRMFVSNAMLVTTDGREVPFALDNDGVWQTDEIALLDFEDGSGHCTNGTPQTNTTLRGQVPDGDYTALRFEIGVPFEVNHGDPTSASSPLNLTAMFWNWQGGYRFLKFEVSPIAANHAPATEHHAHGGHGGSDWFLHLGSTLCNAPAPIAAPTEACGNPNRVTVALDGLVLSESVVVVDPAPVLAGTDVTSNAPESSPGCMSFPDDGDCVALFPRLGLPFGGVPGSDQSLVTLR